MLTLSRHGRAIEFADQMFCELKGDAITISRRQYELAYDEQTRAVWNVIHQHIALMLND